MVEQPIIQAAISSIETFDGTKSKFESWIASVGNAAQISGKNILCMAFSNMVELHLTSANILRDHLPHLTWNDLKMNFQGNSQCATQAFAHLQQGPDELLEMYLHHTSELLSKIHHTMDMSQIIIISTFVIA